MFSGLHTNYSLMEELIACKKAVGKVVPGAPNVRSLFWHLHHLNIDEELKCVSSNFHLLPLRRWFL